MPEGMGAPHHFPHSSPCLSVPGPCSAFGEPEPMLFVQLNTSISRRGTVIGTPFWMAPEVISSAGPEAGYNSKVRLPCHGRRSTCVQGGGVSPPS